MRIFLIVLDSVGLGEAPDAAAYGDVGSDTLGHILVAHPETRLDNLARLGLFHIEGTSFRNPQGTPVGCYARATELSPGKDTTTGHWEMSGIRLDKPFPVYHERFPDEIIQPFIERTGRGVLGNCVASGTEIMAELGEEQLRTGKWIVYTSADSVFQVAAHESIIPVEELYRGCRIARELLVGENQVGRVIARPFEGVPGNFHRTDRRRDFSLLPPSDTMLDRLKAGGLDVIAIGKIEDIFAGRGITSAIHTHNNDDGIVQTLKVMDQQFHGLAFMNLVDFDMVYGHRNDVKGYAEALEKVDIGIGKIIDRMQQDDVLMITADHGCDPTTPSTDHSRERVPLLIYGPALKKGIDLGTRIGFWDCSATVLSLFGLPVIQGKSVAEDIRP